MKTRRAAEVLLLVERVAQDARAAGELGEFLGALERIRVEALLSPPEPVAEQLPERPSQLLKTKEVARRTGFSAWWVRQNKDALPIVRLPTGGYRFSERELEKWIERRRRPGA